MRKYLAIMMCAGLLLTATGCGDNKETETKDEKKTEEKEETKKAKFLNCSYEEEFDDMSMAMRLVLMAHMKWNCLKMKMLVK